jgi:formate dehydrogenase alpha subunit
VAGLATSFGSGAMTNSINEILGAELLFLIGTNTTEAHPVIGYKMKQAKRAGTKLIVIDPRRTELAEEADYWLQLNPGTDIPLLNGIMHIIIKENLYDKKFVEERTENFEALKETVEKYTPEYASEISGVPVEDIYAVARLYAKTDKAGLFYTLGITEHICGTNNVMSTANLAMLTGHLGRESTGVNPLRGQNNVQGACDMGALPNVYTGYQKVTDQAAQEKFEKAWGAPMSGEFGLMIPEMFDKANSGELKAMYILGENPVLTDPNANHIKSGLENLEFLVVHELFLTETAEYADVILPAASFAETDGTFTNTERRVQWVRKAIDPLPGKTNWQTIIAMSTKMGYAMSYNSAEEIFNEMASLTPSYAGMSYERIDAQGLQWPCPTADHPGTKFLHGASFTRGKGLFQGIDHVPPAELPCEEYPLLLSTGRILFHYNVTTPYSAGIQSIWNEEYAEVNPDDASRLGIKTGEQVKVTSRRGEVTTKVTVTDRVPPGVIWMSFHYTASPTNVLTSDAVDPITKTGEYKVCAVKVEKLESCSCGGCLKN